MFVALELPPGVYRNGTAYQSQGRFYDADLWRWHQGTMRPVGGWLVHSDEALEGKARAVITWQDNQSSSWIGVGTHSNLYAVTRSGAVIDITPADFVASRPDAEVGGGYGLGPYGDSTYGTLRTGVENVIPARVWSLDTFGEVLIGTAGRTIYEWTLDTSAPAVAVTNAPRAFAVLVTEERIIMALGSGGDPRAIDWCDAEDRNDWTPTSTNLAGGKRLQTSGKIQAGRRVRGGNLIFTDVDVHFATFRGLPFVYGFERLATGCGLIAKGAVAVVDDKAFWMGANGFWSYNGFVTPLECDVADYVFSDINQTQISKATAWHNALWGEIWFHYPSADSEENDRYVVYNYREGHWSIGSLERLAGVDQGVFPYPLLTGEDGHVYRHEVGHLKDDRQPFATSGPVEIGTGDRTMEVHAVIPDESNLGDVSFSFSTGDYPMSPGAVVAASSSSAKTDVRFSARRVAVTITAAPDQDFRVGQTRFDAKPGTPR